MSNILFRTNGGAELGYGHLMRCRVLADLCSGKGWKTTFALPEGNLLRIPEGLVVGHRILPVPDDPLKQSEFINAENADGVDWLVVDDYGLDEKFESACRSWVGKILGNR